MCAICCVSSAMYLLYNGCSAMCAGADRTLRIAVNMVTKALLQYLMLLAPDPDFPELWSRILQVLTVSVVPAKSNHTGHFTLYNDKA